MRPEAPVETSPAPTAAAGRPSPVFRCMHAAARLGERPARWVADVLRPAYLDAAGRADLAAGLRALRLDSRAFCRRVQLVGWRPLAEAAGALLAIDGRGPWPVALRAAALFGGADAVADRDALAAVLSTGGEPEPEFYDALLYAAAHVVRPREPGVIAAELGAGKRIVLVAERMWARELCHEVGVPGFDLRAERLGQHLGQHPGQRLRVTVRPLHGTQGVLAAWTDRGSLDTVPVPPDVAAVAEAAAAAESSPSNNESTPGDPPS